MENRTSQTQNRAVHKNSTSQSPLVEISRVFQASVESLWSAWSEPEMLKQWWGPENYSCPDAKIDFRVGGKSLLAMKGPDGKVIWSGGTYEEIVPKTKIVSTDSFMDEKGNVISAEDAGMPGNWQSDTLYITVEFEKLGENETKMGLSHEGIPKEMYDDCVSGWNSSIDKLQKLVERQ